MATTLTNEVSAPSTTSLPPADAKARVSQFMKDIQDEICSGLEKIDGLAKFKEDSWQREEGGGGRSRVLCGGGVFEQAGVNFSEVWGQQLPPSIHQLAIAPIALLTLIRLTNDTIAIDDVGFGGGLAVGTLLETQFVLGTAAADSDDRFIYNKSTGALFFDVDGTGATTKI